MALVVCLLSGVLCSSNDALPSWNDNSANKQAIIDFVESVTDKKSDSYVPEEERTATFDMDGTIVVESLCRKKKPISRDQPTKTAPISRCWN